MKVLHVAPSVSPRFGGPTEALIGFVRSAEAASMEVTVIAPEAEAREVTWITERLGQQPKLFPGVGSGGGMISPALWAWLARHGPSYDVVHLHGLFNSVTSISARIALRRGFPTIIRPFGTLSRYTFAHRKLLPKRLFFHLLDGPNLRRASALHFATQAEREEALRHLGLIGVPSHVIPPPAPFTASGEEFVREPRNASPVAVFIGRLHPVKDLPTLLAAWGSVTLAVAGAQLIIAGVGDEAYVTHLRTLIRQHGIEASVSFAGFLDTVRKAALLRRATTLVLPSHHENLGMVVLEALQAGIPVVVTQEVALSTFIAANDVGIVATRDATELGRALIRALTDEGLANRSRLEGPALVRREFSEARIGAQLRIMYESAGANRTSRTRT